MAWFACLEAAAVSSQGCRALGLTCQGPVSLADSKEDGHCSRVRVLVRMILQRQSPICLFDVLLCCPPFQLHTEGFLSASLHKRRRPVL